jgi:hypothetical protein
MMLWSVTHGAGMTSLIAKVDHITNKQEGIEYMDSILHGLLEGNQHTILCDPRRFHIQCKHSVYNAINLDTTNASIIGTVNIIE